ncbi:MAG: alpha/beta fold hydrolase [Caldilineaceae bacterium]
MATEIIMPKWGLSMQEGLIGQWLKQEGDTVAAGEPLVEIETEKITNVVEAPTAGILAHIVHQAGATIPVQQVIAWITAPGEAIPATTGGAATGAASATVSAGVTATTKPEAAPAPKPSGGAVTAMPAARRLAKERHIDLATITGTGPNGAITVADVEQAASAAKPVARTGVIPATPVARKLAKDHGLDLATIQGSGVNGIITKEDVAAALAASAPTAPSAGQVVPALQKVGFYSDGLRLDGLLYSPQGTLTGEGRTGVVLCVGYTYTKNMVMPDIAKVLTAAGYVALVFDYRGFGESEGARARLMPLEQVDDIRAALTFLADQPHVDAQKLAVVGISLGASHAMSVGALDQRVQAVVALEPMGDGERWLQSLRRHWEWQAFQAQLAADRVQRVRTGASSTVDSQEIVLPDPESRVFLEQVAAEFPQSRCNLSLASADALIDYSPESIVGQMEVCSSLIIHGDSDQLVPVAEARSLADHAGSACRLAIIPDMGHFNWVLPNGPRFKQVAALTVSFLQEVLPAM